MAASRRSLPREEAFPPIAGDDILLGGLGTDDDEGDFAGAHVAKLAAGLLLNVVVGGDVGEDSLKVVLFVFEETKLSLSPVSLFGELMVSIPANGRRVREVQGDAKTDEEDELTS